MLTTNKQRVNQVYECVKTFHSLEVLPSGLPDPQNVNLLPTLRPYQVKAVNWMLWKELHPSYYERYKGNSSKMDSVVLLPKGGILADEMGLGKTVEMLACILSNPRKMGGNTESLVQVEGPSKSISEEKNLETTIIIHSSNEDKVLEPIEDIGLTVEIDNGHIKPREELKHGLCIFNDSGCVMDLENSKFNKGNLENEEVLQAGNLGSRKRKARKQVKFDDDIIPNQPKRQKIRDKSLEDKRSAVDNGEPKTKQLTGLGSEKYRSLRAWYNDSLTEYSGRSIKERVKQLQQESTFKCCCVADVISDNVVQCPECQTWQHAECVGYDVFSTDYQYYCFQCWKNQLPVKSAGTVIISPEAISQQWVAEIEKHVEDNKLRVLVYEGVRVNGYIQPPDLANYNVIITTYQVLTKELNYTDPVSRNLRHAKRFFAPMSPLLSVQWWRLCLDEAQMVEGSTCHAAEMAKKFYAINKWAITGTPIQKAVNDVIGLMEFLAGTEYKYLDFINLMREDWRSLLKLVPRVLWRTQMKDVLEETGVPPQSEETHMLDFSKIEKYFYRCTHRECSQLFSDRISRFDNLNVILRSLDRKAIDNLLNPLLKLRQACLHPQAVRGKFMSVKKTMTMEDLVSQMVTKAKQNAEQAMRQLVSSLNGIGALQIIREEWKEAVEAYRGVLHLDQEYDGRLKIDSLQKIHAMHNLAEVLDGHYDGIAPTLRDSTLRDDLKALELRYLGKREAPITMTEKRVDQHAEAIAEILKGCTIGYSEWYFRLMEWSSDRERLLDRLKSAIQHTDLQQKNQYNNLARKLRSLYIVRLELAQWLAEVDTVRDEVRKWLQKLRTSDRDMMACDALTCHLPQAASIKIKNRTRCKLCKAEGVLKKYEALIFEEKSKEIRRKRDLPGSSNWGDDNDVDNKEIAELVEINVNTFESSKKGGFKASPFEKILRELASYGHQKRAPGKWLEEATNHISLLGRLKKEFLDLNLLWRQIFDSVDAKDELNMCKTRLRLPYDGEEEELKSKKKKIGENHHIISLYRVDPELLKLIAEKNQYEALLKKKIGVHCYLKTLENEGAPAPICPICRNDLTERWSVLQCGHCLCLECMSLVLKPMMASIQCPQCRQNCSVPEISYVESKPTENALPEVNGSYSTKINAVTYETLKLIKKEPNVKILVFSAWEKVLDVVAEAFEGNNITFRRMKSGAKLKTRQYLKDFKTEDVTALLLPLRSGAKGLNLVEATHVFLVEPILNPAEELQAIGRVHRIGQTKPTVVHRFIVRETIEERILAAVSESGPDQWSEDCISLRQLFNLFSTSFDLSYNESDLSFPQESLNEEISDAEFDNDIANNSDGGLNPLLRLYDTSDTDSSCEL